MFLDTWVLLTVAELFAPVQQKVGPKRRLGRSIHVCERTDGLWGPPPAALADELYQQYVGYLRQQGLHVETGTFQAMMKVELANEGPVTILLDSKKLF